MGIEPVRHDAIKGGKFEPTKPAAYEIDRSNVDFEASQNSFKRRNLSVGGPIVGGANSEMPKIDEELENIMSRDKDKQKFMLKKLLCGRSLRRIFS